jgi:hypothetical protein
MYSSKIVGRSFMSLYKVPTTARSLPSCSIPKVKIGSTAGIKGNGYLIALLEVSKGSVRNRLTTDFQITLLTHATKTLLFLKHHKVQLTTNLQIILLTHATKNPLPPSTFGHRWATSFSRGSRIIDSRA